MDGQIEYEFLKRNRDKRDFFLISVDGETFLPCDVGLKFQLSTWEVRFMMKGWTLKGFEVEDKVFDLKINPVYLGGGNGKGTS